MNRTLLLILCDFLLLNLLALTRWEKAEPPRTRQPPVPELAGNAVTKDQDLVDTMRQSLAEERQVRDELAQRLASTGTTLAAREQSLAQAEQSRAATAASLADAQRTAAELARKASSSAQEAALTKEQLAQLQRELAERQAEAARQARALAALERQNTEARSRAEQLAVRVAVVEGERNSLQGTAAALKSQVEVERAERLKVQETTTKLAQGVGQLAEKSGELSREIRDYRPISANTLYQDYLGRRLAASFAATRRVFLGSPEVRKESSTVLVRAGGRTFAVMHLADTVFTTGDFGIDLESLRVELARGPGAGLAVGSVAFLAQDPRVVLLPLAEAQAAVLGVQPYLLAADPFRFPEAVLIDGGGRGYGEVGFKLDVSEPGFVRVDNRLFKRLFGDFAPKRGDLVLAKTGELLGVMVNGDYCALLGDFAPWRTVSTGPDTRAQGLGALQDELTARVRALPPGRQ